MTQTAATASPRCYTTVCTETATHTVNWSDGDYAHLCYDCAWSAYHGTNGYDDHGSSMTTGIVGDVI
jgi:hypothetical protein